MKRVQKIGILTSGGDSPGMNACIRAIVRTAVSHNIQCVGILEGYDGLVKEQFVELTTQKVANIIHRGGTILKSSRSAEFRTKEGRATAFLNIQKHQIDAVICIGGDGSYTGAHIFESEFGVPMIGCPGTIDNDLFGTDYTIGFHTAVDTVVNAIDKLRDTAESHNMVFFVEVMGRHCGDIALMAGLAAGAQTILVPEVKDDFNVLLQSFGDTNRQKEFSIIVVAEGEELGNATEIAHKFETIYPSIKPRVTILGHIQRGGTPTANDRILASLIGSAAVQNLIQGNHGIAIGVENNKISTYPLEQVIKSKRTFNFELWNLSQILSK